MSTQPPFTVIEYSSIALDPQGANLDSGLAHGAWLTAVLDCEIEGAPTPETEAEALALCNEVRLSLLTVDPHQEAGAVLDQVARYVTRSLGGVPQVWASMALYNAARREVWLVGEGLARVGNVQHGQASASRIARQQSRRGAARALRAEGATDAEMLLLPPPPPTEQLAPALNGSGSLAVGALNGTPIPPWLITVIEVPSDETEVVLATRGYPYVGSTLQESEIVLRDLMLNDPFGTDQALTDDGWRLGTTGFADRTYLRLGIRPSTAERS